MKKSHCTEAYKATEWMLKLTGIWPMKNAPLLYKIKTVTSWVLCLALYTILVVETITVVNDMAELSEVLLLSMVFTTWIPKMIVFKVKEKTFFALLDDLNSDKFNSHPERLDPPLRKTIDIINKIANMYKVSAVGCISFYLFFPIIDHKPLPIPFSYDLGSYHYCMFVFQLVALGVSAWNQAASDILCSSFMGLAGAQIDILRGRLAGIVSEAAGALGSTLDDDQAIDEAVDRKVNQVLKICITHHLAIIEYINRIEEMFSICILVQYLASGITICVAGFQILVIAEPGSSQYILLGFYFFAVFIELAMYCWFGNEILVKSVKIGEACYMSNWYHCSSTIKKSLFIIMEAGKRPLGVTAYKFTLVSLESFADIIRWSYSTLALLRKVYSD